ncbi:MAG: hypothetical protein J3K34DRAFT_225622 [Monoraphidium minutum]|nr:MAG: hypothetical protein J3K34DRAFT_225622 [Monoraphidium minutum]
MKAWNGSVGGSCAKAVLRASALSRRGLARRRWRGGALGGAEKEWCVRALAWVCRQRAKAASVAVTVGSGRRGEGPACSEPRQRGSRRAQGQVGGSGAGRGPRTPVGVIRGQRVTSAWELCAGLRPPVTEVAVGGLPAAASLWQEKGRKKLATSPATTKNPPIPAAICLKTPLAAISL